MTIKEWLTPDFFAVNVILIALLMNFTIYGIVSNFTIDFRMGDRLQSGIYASATFSALIYATLVILGFAGIISNYPYLYDNKYNFLLLGTGERWGGNGPVFVSILAGAAIGAAIGLLWGRGRAVKIWLGICAVASEALIAGFTLLWITNQT